MKKILVPVLAALGFSVCANAQLWNGDPLPPDYTSFSNISHVGIDPFFSTGDVGGVGLTAFDNAAGTEFSLQLTGNEPRNIDAAHGWVNAATYATMLNDGDSGYVTYLGKTAGWADDFGITIGGKNAYGAGASTLWNSIVNGAPAIGDQYSFGPDSAGPELLDFWLNSDQHAYDLGGTYSLFYPDTSDPENSGVPSFDYSARGKLFYVYDNYALKYRTILVMAVEDWRDFDADFTDLFFGVEIVTDGGGSGFSIPEPSTYGLIGAMMLIGVAAVRRYRRQA